MACVNETCSILPTIDATTGALSLDAKLSPTGCLQCVDPAGLGVKVAPLGCLACAPEGLGVLLNAAGALGCTGTGLTVRRYAGCSGDPSALAGEEIQTVCLSPTNELFLNSDRTIYIPVAGSVQVDIPAAGTSNNSIAYAVKNCFSKQLLVGIYCQEPKRILTTDPPSPPTVAECYHQGNANLRIDVADINGNTQLVARNDYATRTGVQTQLQWSTPIFTYIDLNPGQTVNVELDYSTGANQNFARAGSNGFQALKNFVIAHLNTDTVPLVPC